jgi:hypothetical protein
MTLAYTCRRVCWGVMAAAVAADYRLTVGVPRALAKAAAAPRSGALHDTRNDAARGCEQRRSFLVWGGSNGACEEEEGGEEGEDDDGCGEAPQSLNKLVVDRLSSFVREIKATTASEFECALLKGTRPDAAPAKEKHVARLVETVATFPLAMEARKAPNTDYYHMILHKLWSRMAESDWRTIAKALYIFHRVAISLDVDLHREFLRRYAVLRKMTHTRSRSAYFKSAKLLEFEPRDFEYRVFLEKYAAFVLDRFACFSGRFGESPMLGSTSDPRRLVASLKTMGRILDKAIQVVNAHERISNGVTLQCTELIVRDCFLARNKRESLWQVFCNTLAQLLSNQQQHGLVEENLARNTQHLLKWTLRVRFLRVQPSSTAASPIRNSPQTSPI